MRCSICGIRIDSVEEAADQAWTPCFSDVDQKHEFASPECSEALLQMSKDGGMEVKEKYMRFQKRHIPSLERIDLREEVSTALARLGDQANVWRVWTGRPLSETAYGRVMEAMQFGERAEKEIGNRIAQEADGVSDEGFPILTVWAFYNILTWYITHMAVSLNHRVTMEERLRKAIIHIGGM